MQSVIGSGVRVGFGRGGGGLSFRMIGRYPRTSRFAGLNVGSVGNGRRSLQIVPHSTGSFPDSTHATIHANAGSVIGDWANPGTDPNVKIMKARNRANNAKIASPIKKRFMSTPNPAAERRMIPARRTQRTLGFAQVPAGHSSRTGYPWRSYRRSRSLRPGVSRSSERFVLC